MLDFRIVTDEPGVRPASAAYGMPYDLADLSEGSALSELLSQARLQAAAEAG